MSEILRKTDFRVKVSFIDLNQTPIAMGDVKFTFYTAAPCDYYSIEYQGRNTTKCQLQDDGLICVVSKHCFASQNLMLKCQYDILSEKYPDGRKRVTQIKIVDSYSTTPSGGAVIPTHVPDLEEGVAVNISVVYDAIKGNKGKDGVLPEIDYSDLTEIAIENTF